MRFSRTLFVKTAVAVGAVGFGCEGSGSDDAAPTAPSLCTDATSLSFVRPFQVDEKEYPFKSCAFDTGHGRLHFIDEGPRDAHETILMVHGNPTWSYLYRKIASAMVAKGHRVVVVDHLGMGMSDAPDPSRYDYRPRSHSADLQALVDAMDLHGVTLVVQDWGGPVGLGVATREPDRFRRLLVMNTWAWSVDPANRGTDHGLIDWGKQATDLDKSDPDFGCNTMLTLTADTLAQFVDPSKGAQYSSLRSAYRDPSFDEKTGTTLPGRCTAMSTFAISILGDNAYQGEVQAGLSRLRGKPYALISGLADNLFGGLRCDASATSPCPTGSTCVCDPAYTFYGPCNASQDPVARADSMCEVAGVPVEANLDEWVSLLGASSLVQRRSLPGVQHMVQEFEPDAVIVTLGALIAVPANP